MKKWISMALILGLSTTAMAVKSRYVPIENCAVVLLRAKRWKRNGFSRHARHDQRRCQPDPKKKHAIPAGLPKLSYRDLPAGDREKGHVPAGRSAIHHRQCSLVRYIQSHPDNVPAGIWNEMGDNPKRLTMLQDK